MTIPNLRFLHRFFLQVRKTHLNRNLHKLGFHVSFFFGGGVDMQVI